MLYPPVHLQLHLNTGCGALVLAGTSVGLCGESYDAQMCVSAVINVKARSKRQHSPICLQYPMSGYFAFPGWCSPAVGCWLTPC